MSNMLPIYLKDIKIAIINIEKFIEGLDSVFILKYSHISFL